MGCKTFPFRVSWRLLKPWRYHMASISILLCPSIQNPSRIEDPPISFIFRPVYWSIGLPLISFIYYFNTVAYGKLKWMNPSSLILSSSKNKNVHISTDFYQIYSYASQNMLDLSSSFVSKSLFSPFHWDYICLRRLDD